MAEAELALVNKVDLRIALASDDKQFESSVNLYLAPILLKLASPYGEVRKAVLKIIQNVIPRITAASSIKLPVEALLKQVKNPNVPPTTDCSSVRLYSLLFVSRGIDRLSKAEKCQLVPTVIENISSYSPDVSARLFNVFCKLIQVWTAPEKDSPQYQDMRQFLEFDKYPESEVFLTRKFSQFFMLQPNSTATVVEYPGLSVEDVAFFTTKAGVTYKTQQEIFDVKVKLLEFLKAGFDNSCLWEPLLVASMDSSSAINDNAEVSFKKLNIDVDNELVLNRVVSMYIGSNGVPPVKPPLQEKIILLLLKSTTIASHKEFENLISAGLSSDYAKLKSTTLQLLKVASKENKKSKTALGEFTTNIISQLKENIINDGWPKLSTSSAATSTQRLLQYEAFGNILKHSPELFLNDLTYIKFLFDSLEGEVNEFRSIIQEILSSLTVHLPQLSTNAKLELKEVIKRYLVTDTIESSNIDSCRYIAVKFNNATYGFDDAEARYLSLLATAKENKSDTIEEANKGLHPYWFNILQSSNTNEFKSTPELLGEKSLVSFPSFSDFVTILNSEIHRLKDSEGAVVFKVLGRAIEFAFQVLTMESVQNKTTVIVTDEDWSVRLSKSVELDKTVRELLTSRIKAIADFDVDMESLERNATNKNPLLEFLLIILNAISGHFSTIDSNIGYTEIFARVVSMSPSSVIGNLTNERLTLLGLLRGKLLNDASIYQISRAIGIILSHPDLDDTTIQSIMQELSLKNSPKYLLKGKILVTGFLISRLYLRKRISTTPIQNLKDYCDDLLNFIQDSNYYPTVLDAVSQLSIFGVFGPVLNNELEPYVAKLISIIKPNVKKCDEKSIIALACLSLSIGKNPDSATDKTDFENAIYDTHVSKQIEFTFTSGEALLILVAGWQAKNLLRELDIQGESVEYIIPNISRLHAVLEHVLESCLNTKPSLRKAGCIWLLSLVQFCGDFQEVKEKTPQIHIAFLRFLSDRDELVQESASRGLSMVYEMGDVELKDSLVRSLLKSFTDSNSTQKLASGSVDQDTELFDKEYLKTNDGSVSTYRDVLNLATDVGDPSLVYKFMSLAKSSALWSSRKGIAFGLGSILSKSSLDLLLSNNKALADRLIAKLYRYRYDPNTSVQQSMNVIWNTLIKDTPTTVRENFKTILPELLKSMGNKEWRTREASAAALRDLLQIVPLSSYEDKLEDIWNMSFRVLDDIKESVRKEGTKLTKSLTVTLLRSIDTKHGGSKENSEEVLEHLIPLFLGNKGLLSDSEDVKNFALKTILDICKIGNNSVKPFVPKLVDNFINLMSTLEPDVINYLILNADKYNLQHNDIDAKRLRSIGQSPMMDAIEKLLDLLDDDVMDEFVSKLQSSIKRSVGLPSKVCGSRVLVTMITKHYELTKPYGDRLLKIAILQIKDKNLTVATSYASAAGYLCRIASVTSVVDFSERINKLYFESEDEKGRELAAIASENVARYSGDKFELVATAFLPLAFIGKYDDNKVVKSNFEREWIENTSGNNNSIKLYLQEIQDFFKKYISSNKFEIRRTLGRSISNLSSSIDDLNQLSEDSVQGILKLLLEANKAKSWDGKETVLEALVTFSVKAKSLLDTNNNLRETIDRAVLVESRRRNKNYQKHAVKLLGKYLHVFPQDELVEAYIDIMEKVLLDKSYRIRDDMDSDDSDDDAMDVDSDMKLTPKQNLELEELKITFLDNLASSFYVADNTVNSEFFTAMLDQFCKAFQSKVISTTWRTKIAINDALSSILKLIQENKCVLSESQSTKLFDNWKQLREQCSDIQNIEKVKILFLRFSQNLLVYYRQNNEADKTTTMFDSLKKVEANETSNIIKTEVRLILNQS
jgi:proteasome component ECM29